MTRIRNLRWWIAGLLAAATALNYLDRQSLPVLVAEVQKSIPISDQQYSQLQMLFLLAYGIMYIGGGRVMDLLGTRLGYAVMILWWSVATVIHGLVQNVFGLGLARFLLGIGEGGGFPGSAKAVSEWFPAKERSLAFGLFNTGSSVGAVIAPPLIASVALWLNWRWVFVITGVAGFLWTIAWLLMYRAPGDHKLLTESERKYLHESMRADARAGADAAPPVSWAGLFRYRQIWGLIIAKFLTDPAWYFFIFWIPKYLADVRHLDIREIGYYAWIPYAFAGGGSLIGGWLSSFLIRRAFTVDHSRKIALAVSAALMPASLLISAAPLGAAIVFFSMALFGHQFWSTIMQTLAADLFPSKVVGSVAGLMGGIGSFGGMLFNLAVGALLTRYHSYHLVFLISGLLHPASFAILLLLLRRIEPVRQAAAAPAVKRV